MCTLALHVQWHYVYTGIKYIHIIVQPSLPFIFRTFLFCKTETLDPELDNNALPFTLSPWQLTFYFLSL